jgi:hypothetical protein
MSDQENTPVDVAPEAPVAEKPEAKKTRQMTFTVLETGEIRAEFGEGVEPLVLSPAQVPEALQAAAVTEGLISRLRGYTSKLVDKDRTPSALAAAVAKGMENLKAGVWKIERAPGEGTPDYSIEVEASFLFRQMRAKAKGEPVESAGTIEQAAENFAKLSDEQKKTLKALPRYQLALAEVKAARAAAKLKALTEKVEAGGDEDGF